MRADRLLVLLLLLQTRGRVTAQSLSKRLEVSERTIYRDLVSLSMAGVPVYAERGPGGGWSLLEDYRTNLTRLTEAEVNTLFVSGTTGPLKDLGLGKASEDAMLKLLAALPSVYRNNAELARQRIHLDAIGWFRHDEPVPHLPLLQEAVWNDRRLRLTYRRGNDNTINRRTVNPYGLVAKSGIWYLVCATLDSGGEMRVYRVGRILEAELTSEHFERPADFDLITFWTSWLASFERSRYGYAVKLRLAPEHVEEVSSLIGDWVRLLAQEAGPPDEQGRITLLLYFESPFLARLHLLNLGPIVEVIEPQELRDSIADYASRIAALYNK
ncbi:MAG: helix-turn-helix transcriptional regulator [Ktedonobacteraceae bacterium]